MSRIRLPFAHRALMALCSLALSAPLAHAEPDSLRPLDPERPLELAPYMAELGRLFHKLALSIEADNPELARFYAYESQVQLERTQEDVPVYNGLPIAILIERYALPSLGALDRRLADPETRQDRSLLFSALDDALARCNACHVATDHGFLRITRGTEVNPFNQDFRPLTTKGKP